MTNFWSEKKVSFFQFNFILIGGKLLYNFVLVFCWTTTGISQNYTYIPALWRLPPLPPLHCSRSSESPGWTPCVFYQLPTILHMTRFIFMKNEEFKSSLRTIGEGNFFVCLEMRYLNYIWTLFIIIMWLHCTIYICLACS